MICSKKSKEKVFKTEWLNEVHFQGWLERVSTNNRLAKCTYCNKLLTCGHSGLMKHARGQTHVENASKIRNQSSHSQKRLDKYFEQTQQEINKKRHHEKQVKNFELLLSAYFAEHNVAISVMDHLVDVLKRALPDSSIMQDVSLKRTKVTAIIKNIIAQHENDTLISDLKVVRFSILCDESTDITSKKLFSIVVRYVSPKSGEVQTKLLELVPLNAVDLRAAVLYEVLQQTLLKYEVPIQHILGVASDGAAVMIGKHNSFFSNIKREVPHAILLQCICHSASLIASEACKKLPIECESLIRSICTYISGSAKRCDQLKELQTYFNMEHSKIIKLSNTRWLSLQHCVVKTLEHWDVFISYFTVASFEQSESADQILKLLQSKKIKCLLIFLKYVLNFMNSFNALFQSNNILIHLLYNKSRKLLVQFAQNFIKPQILMSDIAYDKWLSSENYLESGKMFVGAECKEFMTTHLTYDEQRSVHNSILDFYVTATKQMLQRLPLNNIFMLFEFVSPTHVFNKNRSLFENLDPLCDQFKSILTDIYGIKNEWRLLPFHFDEKDVLYLSELPIDIMWHKISQYEEGNELRFKNICELANIILALPHSNAECERIFSVVNDVRTKKRNKIGDDTLNSICLIRSSFNARNVNCTTFVPNEEHFKLFTSEIYSKK